MGELVGLVAVLGFFAVIGVPIYHHTSTRHKERMALIEKGIVTEDVKYLYDTSNKRHNPYGSLKWGLIFIAGGLGLFIAQILTVNAGMDESTYPAIIALGIGTALIMFYRIALKRQRVGEAV
jgi:hypothetical protein